MAKVPIRVTGMSTLSMLSALTRELFIFNYSDEVNNVITKNVIEFSGYFNRLKLEHINY